MNKLPNFLIIGVQKGGSTWLYDVLKVHPEIFLPKAIELHHFNRHKCNEEYALIAYQKHFEETDECHKMVGEKTPSYFWTISKERFSFNPKTGHNPNLVKDVKNQLGNDLKLIVSLRHPVKRAISAFFHHVKRGRIEGNISISEYYKEFGILDMGYYSEHLMAWLQEYEREQLKVLIMERDIIKNPKNILIEVCDFLGVSSSFEVELEKKSNVGLDIVWKNGKISLDELNSPYISSEDITFMLNSYKDDMNNLRKILNDPLDEWKKIDNELLSFVSKNI